MGTIWISSGPSAEPVLLKWFWCLNNAWNQCSKNEQTHQFISTRVRLRWTVIPIGKLSLLATKKSVMKQRDRAKESVWMYLRCFISFFLTDCTAALHLFVFKHFEVNTYFHTHCYPSGRWIRIFSYEIRTQFFSLRLLHFDWRSVLPYGHAHLHENSNTQNQKQL